MPPTVPVDEVQEWFTIPNVELKGKYEICRQGYVRNKKTHHIMTPWDDKNGYPHVSLNVDKSRSYAMHRLIALQFIENTNPGKFDRVHHRDEDPHNWSIDNLEWIDQKGNMQAHVAHRKKLGLKHTGRKLIYKVVQYDLQMNLIKIWDSLDAVMQGNPSYNRDAITGTCTYNHKNTRGFVWRYMDEAGTIITKDYTPPPLPSEEFRRIGIIRGKDLSKIRVSNLGRFINERGDIIKPSMKKKYPEINFRISKDVQASFGIHILVAEVFVSGKTAERCEVNHENKDTRDFKATNLRWVTPSENKQHATGIAVRMINGNTFETEKEFGSYNEAARFIGKSNHTVIKYCDTEDLLEGHYFKVISKKC